MPIDPSTIRAHEWIGLRVKVLSAPDPGICGVTGKVEDESRNMLTIRTNHRSLKVPKEKSSFLVELPGKQSVEVHGETVRYRPEDRVKRGIGKW
ncbi:ribonuclease P protein subunit [Candidatus Bathyarchaeota archaeon]|nr:MAG: ribonuclease P protein subunit [Candidatus Bathyarchaeota archaeon]